MVTKEHVKAALAKPFIRRQLRVLVETFMTETVGDLRGIVGAILMDCGGVLKAHTTSERAAEAFSEMDAIYGGVSETVAEMVLEVDIHLREHARHVVSATLSLSDEFARENGEAPDDPEMSLLSRTPDKKETVN